MNDEEKKERLSKYLIAVDSLRTKCEDAARWESMSLGPSGELRSRSGSRQPDEIKETAIQLRRDCERQAVEVRGLRRKMDEAFALMETDRLRALLECKYIEGMSHKELCEKKHFSDRHIRRLMTQALHELDRSSTFFT